MTEHKRFIWWDRRTGSEYIFEWNGAAWEIFEREWGGVRWYPVNATRELMMELQALLVEAGGAAA
jgi:hypothetical protein